MQVIEGEDSDIEKIGYTWDVVSMGTRSMELQLNFENPLYISVNSDSEKLVVVFNDGTALLSEDGLPLDLANEDNTPLKIEREIPK